MFNVLHPNLFSISSLRDFVIQLQHFIGRGFFALPRIQPFALNDGLLWGKFRINSTSVPPRLRGEKFDDALAHSSD